MKHVSPTGFGPPPRAQPRRPKIVFQPGTYESLARGVDQLVNALKPTLGPLPRRVAIARTLRADSPEILDAGAIIARRIFALPDRSADVGAMLLRQALWRMYEDVGDGTTTMAVMFHSIFRQGIQYLTAGAGNAIRLRVALERNVALASAALWNGAQSLEGREPIERVAAGLCQDDEMAHLLGEIFDIVGAYGTVQVEARSRPGLEREYVEGMYWESSGWVSQLMETDPVRHRAMLDDAAILISDVSVQRADQLLPIMNLAASAKIPNLAVIALNISTDAIGLLVRNQQAKVMGTLAVRTPMVEALDQAAALEDVALLTGGRVICQASGQTLERARLEDLGYARRVWATDEQFGVVGGTGDPRRLRQHIAQLKKAAEQAEGERKQKLRRRLGRLMGGTAILYVGGHTESEAKFRQTVAERTVLTLQAAVEGGVVAGGGAALLRCQAALAYSNGADDEEITARRILAHALEEPLRVLAGNAGYNPETIAGRVKSAPSGYGFDAVTGQVVDMRQAGILDPVNVLDKALHLAVRAAATALTTDVIVHRRRPPECVEP